MKIFPGLFVARFCLRMPKNRLKVAGKLVWTILALAFCQAVMAATPTTTSLSLTSGGSAVTSIASGTTIMLTATVEAGTAPVTPGLVNFCDGAVTHCEDIHILGSAQLTSAGTAIIKLRPGIGSHSYKAWFVGTKSNAASASTVESLAVTGKFPVSVSAPTQTASTTTLSTTVVGTGFPAAAPTGTLSFVDTTHSNTVIGTAALGTGTYLLGLALTNLSSSAVSVGQMVTADFNGDGLPDFAQDSCYTYDIPTYSSCGITINLGNGTGGSKSSSTISTTAENPAFAVGDFNGDGIPDLAVLFDGSFGGSGSIQIFLGNGDGTFTSVTSTYTTGISPGGILVGDFNHDGNADLAIMYSGGGQNAAGVTLLLGNGDGTFQSAAGISNVNYPNSLLTGDFNGDGVPDLAFASITVNASTNTYTYSITAYLSNGDGSFSPASAFPFTSSSGQFQMVAADFDGDGIPDLAVYGGTNGPAILHGNGDGTFTQGTTLSVSSASYSQVYVGDFNGDGIADLVSFSTTSGPKSFLVMEGKGDGTFPTQLTLSTSQLSAPSILADLNGDGRTDFVTFHCPEPNKGSAGDCSGQIYLMAPQWTVNASGSANFALGTSLIEATYPGDSNYAASTSSTTSVTNLEPTTLTLVGPTTAPLAGQPMTLTDTLAPYTASGYTTNGEWVAFYDNQTVVGSAKLSNGVATVTVSAVPAGSNSYTATYRSDAYFATATSAAYMLTTAANTTKLALSASPTSSIVGQSVTLTATLTGTYGQQAGEQVTFASNGQSLGAGTLNSSGTATLATTALTAGVDTVTASYSGDSYNASTASNGIAYTVRSSTQTASSTTLALTASGAAVSSAAVGTSVTLTASVAASGAPVTAGTVLFCDLSGSAQCPGPAQLGTAQLTAAGTASLVTRLGVGSHPLAAIFQGKNAAGASSSVNAPLTITGAYSTSTQFSWSKPQQNTVNLSTVVRAIGPTATPAPTGSVAWVDQTFSNTTLATQSLASSSYVSSQFASVASNPATGSKPFSVVRGDFNGDGIADLAVVNSADATVGILLGNGDGSFHAQTAYPAGSGAYAAAVGDFNHDGKLDLAVVNYSANTVSILLGVGDGSFQAQTTYATGGGPDAIALADLNGDGVLDLAITNQIDDTVSVLLGNGDGTFQTRTNFAVGSGPAALTLADFNGDGVADLAVANNTAGTVSILLGNGDGSFQTQSSVTVGSGPISIAAADLNGDAKMDLAVANLSSNTVTVLAGNGDGSFQTGVSYYAGNGPESLVAASLSGLGRIDLAVVSAQSQQVTVYQNNGSGTFGTSSTYSMGKGGVSLVAGDWNGDGMTDLAALASSDAQVNVLLNTSGQGSSAATSTALSGSTQVVASYPGNTSFAASSSAAQTLSLSQMTTTLALTASPNPSNYGASVALTATLSPFAVGTLSSNGETVTFKSGSATLGTGTLSSGVATLSISSLPVGVDSVQAVYLNDGLLTGSTSNSVSQTVRPAVLTVAGPQVSRAYGQPNPSLAGTVSGAVNGDTFAVTGTTTATTTSSVGTYPVVPTVSGTNIANYTVTTVNGALTVTRATPMIVLSASSSEVFAGNSVTLTAQLNVTAGTPTGTVSFYDGSTLLGATSVTSGSASFNSSSLATGTHSITASYSGDTNFTAATSSAVTETVATLNIGTSSGSGVSSTFNGSWGGKATYSFTVQPSAGTAFPSAVNLSISGLPTGATASFSPASIAAGAGATSVTLAISLPASAALQPQSRPGAPTVPPVAFALLLVPFLLPAGRRLRRSAGWLSLMLLAAACLAVSACGGGSKVAGPTQNYTLTLTASSGNATQSSTLTLVVQ